MSHTICRSKWAATLTACSLVVTSDGAATLRVTTPAGIAAAARRAIPHRDLRPETIVEHNEFVRCNGEAEIVSVRPTGNTIENHTLNERPPSPLSASTSRPRRHSTSPSSAR